jgi:glyoxylase-like metal-dependent hydrolase (beta-lactamase superfamily II)
LSAAASVDVVTLPVGPFESNCHLIHPAGANLACVVDPGDDADRIIAALRDRGWRVSRYLLTHGHMDHVNALADVRAEFPAPVSMHPLDAAWAFAAQNIMPPFYMTPPRAVPIADLLADGERREDLGLAYEVLHTPGHSPGSVSFYFPDRGLLFSGDVLFRDSIGRTDLPGGDAPTLFRSLKRLLELPDETRVFPGHGPATTLGRERARNPFLT